MKGKGKNDKNHLEYETKDAVNKANDSRMHGHDDNMQRLAHPRKPNRSKLRTKSMNDCNDVSIVSINLSRQTSAPADGVNDQVSMGQMFSSVSANQLNMPMSKPMSQQNSTGV